MSDSANKVTIEDAGSKNGTRVNGNKVNPMRIRLPKGKVLKGTELALFEAERDRINALLERRNGKPSATLASLQ